MASGTIVFNKSALCGSNKGYILGKIEYSYDQSQSANTSTVTFTVYVKKDSDTTKLTETTNGTFTYELNINGEDKIGSKKLEILTSYKPIETFTRTITHNSDGSKSIGISGSVKLTSNSSSAYYNKPSTVNTSLSFTTIPRASAISSAGNVTLGNSCSVRWTPASSSFAYKLAFESGSVSYTTGYITPGTTSSYTYTGYIMDISKWAAAMPNSYTATCKVTLYSYTSSSSSSAMGTSSVTFTLTLPSSIKPSISNFTTSLVNGWNGYYVQGKSKCTLSASFAAGTGSYISSYSISGTGISTSGSSGTTSTLTGSGTFTYTAKVTDGRTSVSAAQSIYVYPYANPSISLYATRTSASGSVQISYNSSCSPINYTNSLSTLRIYARSSTSSTWPSSPTQTISLSSTSANSSITLTGFNSTSSYDFKGVVTDAYGSSTTSAVTSVSSEFRIVNINKNKNGLSIGKMSEGNMFDCNLNAEFLQNLYSKDGTIISSDRNIKTNINHMTTVQEELFNKLCPVTYEFKNGTSGRTHYGFVSQDVEDALRDLNLTGQDFAGFCKRVKVEKGEVVLDENSNEVYDYSLRYSEFIALNTYMIQKLQAENNELKAEIQELKEMITASSNNVE